jgi:hypothetical protein
VRESATFIEAFYETMNLPSVFQHLKLDDPPVQKEQQEPIQKLNSAKH